MKILEEHKQKLKKLYESTPKGYVFAEVLRDLPFWLDANGKVIGGYWRNQYVYLPEEDFKILANGRYVKKGFIQMIE